MTEAEIESYQLPLSRSERNPLGCIHSVLDHLFTRGLVEVAPVMESLGQIIDEADDAVRKGLPLPEGIVEIPIDLLVDVRGRLEEIAEDESHIFCDEARQILYRKLPDLQPGPIQSAA